MATLGFLRGNRDFTILWTGQTVSALGTSMSTLVFPLVGYALTGSAAQAGLATTAVFLGLTLTRLPAGALTDRWPRGRVLLLANVFAMLCYASLAVTALTHALTLAQLIAVGFLSGATNSFIAPAASATIRTVVAPADRPAAYAQAQIRNHTASLVGPPVGGALYSLARGLPFVVDTVSYAICAFTITRLRTPLPTVGGERRGMLSDIIEGISFAWSHKATRAILLWGAGVNFAMTYVFVAITLRLVRAGVHPAAIGLVETIAALSGLVGAFIAPAVVSRMRTGLMTMTTGAVLVLAVLPMAWTTSVPVTGALLAVGTFLFPANNSGISAYLVAVVPDQLQGRVNAAGGFIADGGQPLAPLLAGVLISAIGGAAAMLIGTAGVALSLAPLALSPAILRLGRPKEWAVHESASVD